MNKVEIIRTKLDALDDEFYTLSSLYNLHILEIKNLFNNAILKAYEPTLKDEYNLATLLYSNQVMFYFTSEKKSKIINLSTKMFHDIWKIFIKDVEIMSIKSSSIEYYNSLSNVNFINVVVDKVTSKNIYFKEKNSKTLQSNNLRYSYKTRTREEKDFILKNNDIWIFLSQSALHSIKENSSVLATPNKRIIVKIDVFKEAFVKHIMQNLIDKINVKSNEKIAMKIIKIHRDSKIILIKSNIIIPLSFMEYIRNYIGNNTLYKVKFIDIKKK